jgi:hypothetical protein
MKTPGMRGAADHFIVSDASLSCRGKSQGISAQPGCEIRRPALFADRASGSGALTAGLHLATLPFHLLIKMKG